MKRVLALSILCMALAAPDISNAGPAGIAIREVAELILSKFGRGTAGQTLEEITSATAATIARHGEAALPLLRRSGHAGFSALDQAGANAPEVLALFARRGDEAVWLITDPAKLAIFIKHGEPAANPLLKHPGIADGLIGRFGNEAAGAMNALSRQGAQRLSMIASDESLATSGSVSKLLPVVRKYGDEAMDFIWKNKGALAITSVLATFVADPEIYISGAKKLVIDPIAAPIVKATRWSLILPGLLTVMLLPFLARAMLRVHRIYRSHQRVAASKSIR